MEKNCLEGGALSVDKLIGERAPPFAKNLSLNFDH